MEMLFFISFMWNTNSVLCDVAIFIKKDEYIRDTVNIYFNVVPKHTGYIKHYICFKKMHIWFETENEQKITLCMIG